MYGIRLPVRRCARSGLIGFLVAGTSAVLAASVGGATPLAEMVPLKGNVHRLARAQFDVGEAPESLRLSGLDIVFAKTPDQERALQQLLSDQQDRNSQYGSRFGVSEATYAAVADWLRTAGLTVGALPPGRGHLTFFGSKAQIESALRTRIHLFDVEGGRHYANVSAPMVPAALQAAISAIRGLTDFHPKAGARVRAAPSHLSPANGLGPLTVVPDAFYSGADQYLGYVGPTDFAIIYNLQPEYQLGVAPGPPRAGRPAVRRGRAAGRICRPCAHRRPPGLTRATTRSSRGGVIRGPAGTPSLSTPTGSRARRRRASRCPRHRR